MTWKSITLFLGFENFSGWTLMNKQRQNIGRDPCSLNTGCSRGADGGWKPWMSLSEHPGQGETGKKAGWANDSRTREKRVWLAQKIEGWGESESVGMWWEDLSKKKKKEFRHRALFFLLNSKRSPVLFLHAACYSEREDHAQCCGKELTLYVVPAATLIVCSGTQ